MDSAISVIRLDRIKKIRPDLHSDIMELCGSLDPKEYPEAAVILAEKGRTVAPLLLISERLSKSRKERGAKRKAKEAERIILSINTLFQGRQSPARQQHEPLPATSTQMRNRLPGQDKLEEEQSGIHKISERIKEKIAHGGKLTENEVVTYIRSGYDDFLDEAKDADPIPEKKAKIRIGMCGDARQLIGKIVLEKDVTVKQVAGNSFEEERDTEEVQVFIGHGGYESGCGAVRTAKKLNGAGEKSGDRDIDSATVDSIPKEVTDHDDAERQNAIHQAKLAEKAGRKAYGIYFDMETKWVSLEYGKLDGIARRVIESVSEAMKDAGDLSKQTAGFAIVTREGRRYPGKSVVSAGPNEVFESYFYLDRDGDPKLTPKAIGSLKYALSHINGVDKSKFVVVTDPDISIVKKMMGEISKVLREARVIGMVERPRERRITQLQTEG